MKFPGTGKVVSASLPSQAPPPIFPPTLAKQCHHQDHQRHCDHQIVINIDYDDVVHHQAGDDADDDDNAMQSLKSQWGRRHNTSIS